MQDKILKELKELVKIMNSTRNFIIAEAQLLKRISMDIQSIDRKIKREEI